MSTGTISRSNTAVDDWSIEYQQFVRSVAKPQTSAGSPEDSDLPEVPRCPKTRRSIVDRFDESFRHYRHVNQNAKIKACKSRRGKELTEAQNRRLFTDGANPDDFRGYKLTSRQRAQLKVLKKYRRTARAYLA